jgi:hypothetical protein
MTAREQAADVDVAGRIDVPVDYPATLALLDRLERAEAALARVEALADELEAAEIADLRDHHASDLRAALTGPTP